MATYAIGDVQGGYSQLRRLLDACAFEPSRDRLWLVGDLVNRGSESAAVLRFVKSLGERAITVLGNHDLHLLAVAGGATTPKDSDTLRDVLQAPDRDELLLWLRRRPLIHVEGHYLMVHAGLLPPWTAERALSLAHEVETALRGRNWRSFFGAMYGNRPDYWDDSLKGADRLRVIVNAMTRLRVATPEGTMDLSYSGNLEHIPEGLLPWFDLPDRMTEGITVVCGHWAALGLRLRDDLIAIDTGCLWGGRLSAVRLEDRKVFQVACGAAAARGTGR